MNQTIGDKEVIRRYLLGGVAEADLPSLEERILTDDNFYQELLIAEDELIDQYLLDTLSESERSKFVSHFLITPERQDKLRFSKTLKRYVMGREGQVSSDSPELVSAGGDSTRRSWFESYLPITGRPLVDAIFGNRLVLAAFSLLILVAVSVVLINRLSGQKAVSPQDLFVATLTPGLTRDSGETTRIRIPSDKKVVRLELQLESVANSSQSGSSTNNYQSYTAELRTSENSTVLRRDNLLAEVKGTRPDTNRPDAQGNRSEAQGSRQIVNLDVSAEDLKRGDYHVSLSGVTASGATEPIGRYSFRIVN